MSPHVRRPSRTGALACLVFLAAARAGPAAASQPAQAPSLESIVVSADGATVSLRANGPLPEPSTGFLPSPPRIYIDLPGVTPGTVTPPTSHAAAVSRVRVALHSANPLVTRVVIDLASAADHRVDASARQAGRVDISIAAGSPSKQRAAVPGPATSGGATRAPGATPGSAAAGKTAADSPAVAAARARYIEQVSPALARLQGLVPVLTAIEKLDPSAVPADLQATARTFETIGRELRAIKAPAPAVVPHDLLQRACELGASAARLRADSLASGDPSTTANASSAAAGALMLLARGRQGLQ